MKKEATIYDYARMCKTIGDNCKDCPLDNFAVSCTELIRKSPDKASEIIRKWCDENLWRQGKKNCWRCFLTHECMVLRTLWEFAQEIWIKILNVNRRTKKWNQYCNRHYM